MNAMHGWVGRVLVSSVVPLAVWAVGCSPSGVGDPCTPEAIPEGGFSDQEVYLETSSVQCRTRVCLVYKLQGDPSNLQGDDADEDCPKGNDTCVRDSVKEAKVFCSCRCDAPSDVNTPTCSCPGGFECREVLDLGGTGIRGSYCISKEALCCAGDYDDRLTEQDCNQMDLTC